MTDQIYPPKRPNMAHFEASNEDDAQKAFKKRFAKLVNEYVDAEPRPPDLPTCWPTDIRN